MNYKRLFFGMIALSAGLQACATDKTPFAGDGTSREALLQQLRALSYSSGEAVRLYYVVKCKRGETGVPFPMLKVHPPSPGANGVSAAREMFQGDAGVRVAEEPKGVIRIWVGQVPTTILQTRIRSVKFDRLQRYDPAMAIGAVQSVREVKAVENSLGLVPGLNVGGLIASPKKGLPHLPGVMKNLTVDQALDAVAKTWESPVVYGVCANLHAGGTNQYWIEDSGFGQRFLSRKIDGR